jgi:hypothetical protein
MSIMAMSDKFTIENGLKQGDAFQLCFGICYQEGPREPGGTDTEWHTSAFGLCLLMLICKDVNIVGGNIDTIQRNTKALLDASKEVGLEVNPEITTLMMEAVRASEMSVNINLTTWHYIPEDSKLHWCIFCLSC